MRIDYRSIIETEVHLEYIRAPGPGGQNVNKLATAVQLRFAVAASPSLTPEVKQRLMQLAGSRLTNNGEILITARRYRTQEQNRRDAISRLTTLIERAAVHPKFRRATQPTRSSKEKRLEIKKKRSEIKNFRRKTSLQDM